MYKAYAGVGSRKTPLHILMLMEEIAHKLAMDGWTLRSGAADGADEAFEFGCDKVDGQKEIFLPWEGFNGHKSGIVVNSIEAAIIAKKFHPTFQYLSSGAKKLQSRNTHQIYGKIIGTSAKSKFVICWTPDGVEGGLFTSSATGGTGQVIRIAYEEYIPVYNLYNNIRVEEINSWLDKPDKELPWKI